MSRFHYPVVRITPTNAVVVAEHVLLADAREDAAHRDVEGEPAVWYLADEAGTARDHARQH